MADGVSPIDHEISDSARHQRLLARRERKRQREKDAEGWLSEQLGSLGLLSKGEKMDLEAMQREELKRVSRKVRTQRERLRELMDEGQLGTEQESLVRSEIIEAQQMERKIDREVGRRREIHYGHLGSSDEGSDSTQDIGKGGGGQAPSQEPSQEQSQEPSHRRSSKDRDWPPWPEEDPGWDEDKRDPSEDEENGQSNDKGQSRGGGWNRSRGR